MVKRRPHELGDIIYLNSKQAVSMTYYRNNILHLLALPSIISCCFFNVRSMTKDEIVSLVSLAYPFIQKELFLIWDKTQLEDVITRLLEQLSESGLLIKDKGKDNHSYSRPSPNTKAYTQLTLLAKVISPVLEVYYLTLALLSRGSNQEESTTISKQKLVDQCILMSQRVAMIHEINSPDYSDKNLIANFIETLIHIDYLREFDTEQLQYNEVFHKTDKRIRLLLPKQMRANILQMIED